METHNHNTVAHEMQGDKIFAPQTIFRNLPVTTSCFLEMKNVSTFGSNEYVGKQGTADSVEPKNIEELVGRPNRASEESRGASTWLPPKKCESG